MDEKHPAPAKEDRAKHYVRRVLTNLKEGVSALSETHTQDFVYTQVFNFTLGSNVRSGASTYGFSLADLGVRIGHASVWQTYKVNSITMEWFYAGADVTFGGTVGAATEQIGDIVVSIAPYSRDQRSTTATIQSLDPRSIPGTQVKYINARLYYPNIFADGTGTSSTRHTFNQGLVTSASYFQTQPQVLKVTNEKPQYAVQPLALTNTLGGEVYSNNSLALLSGAGRDNTVWHSFFARVDSFDPVARSVIVRGNVIFKVNITFEGI